MRKLLYIDVKNYIEVESESSCKLKSKEYLGIRKDLDLICKCGEPFSTSFRMFRDFDKKQCDKCTPVKERIYNKTTEQFKKEIYDLVANEYTVLGEHTGIHEYIKMKHNTCEYEYEVTPANFTHGKCRCPNCNESKQSNTEEFKQKIYEKYGDEYEVLGEYIRSSTKIKMKHNVCNQEYMVIPNDILSGNKCIICSGLERKTIEIVQKEVYDLVNDEYTVDGEYINNKSLLSFTHKTCGEIFPMNANNFINGQRCPICAESKGEQYIRRYLELHFIDYIAQREYHGLVGVNNGNLSYDFYIKEFNLLIEFQGIQHMEYRKGFHKNKQAFKDQQEHDRRKREYAKENNIQLLEIWYWDIDNIELILNKELNNYKKLQIL